MAKRTTRKNTDENAPAEMEQRQLREPENTQAEAERGNEEVPVVSAAKGPRTVTKTDGTIIRHN